jgi:hypothetical protein
MEIEISRSSLTCILREASQCHPYRRQLVQKIFQPDFESRMSCSGKLLECVTEDEDLTLSLVMSNESHFRFSYLAYTHNGQAHHVPFHVQKEQHNALT